MKKRLVSLILPLLMSGAACASITSAPFGKANGEPVTLYTLKNAAGMEVGIITYGGAIQSIKVPDREGRFEDVALGFDTIGGYLNHGAYMGALVGRYGNRIGGAKFSLDGESHNLPANDGKNTLHGGTKGFDKVVWKAEAVDAAEPALRLSYSSAAGEMGFPGKLDVVVTYTLSADNAIVIDYHAVVDAPTVVNLTNHAYFNLAGHDSGTVLGQQMMIAADSLTPVDSGLIPTGEIRTVAGTPFDFLQPAAIGARIEADNEQIRFGGGYDHNWVLIGGVTQQPRLAARVVDPESGRVLEVLTTEPGIQFYSGNFLDGSLTGKGGVKYVKRSGFCLETQHYPDSPNHDNFPSTTLRPGDEYKTRTLYKFSIAV